MLRPYPAREHWLVACAACARPGMSKGLLILEIYLETFVFSRDHSRGHRLIEHGLTYLQIAYHPVLQF